MKKLLIISGALALTILGGYKLLQLKRAYANDTFLPAAPQQIIAVYDTTSNSIQKNKDSMLHYTLSWINNSESALPTVALQTLIEKKLPVFINLQIWPREMVSKFDDKIASVIVSGYYDTKLIALFNLLAKSNAPVYINYNAEMEVPLYKYPWQAQSFKAYIYSFQHIYKICKQYAPTAKIVWGPAGYPGIEEYWPGDEFVDFVAVNMSMEQELPNDAYPLYPSVAEMMRRKLFRMRFMNKPVLFLGTKSVSRISLQQQSLDELNVQLATDKSIYRTPALAAEHDTTLETKPRLSRLQLGVYDPLLLLTHQPLINAEHIFTDIIGVMNGVLKKDFDAVIARHHDVILTIEPWKDGKVEKDTAILTHTLNGNYDYAWKELYKLISNVPQTVYLRWGHEMEIPVDRYAWQKKDPVTYIKAFRYFATFQKPKANNIKIVWGPAGDRGSVEWWPGEEYVDYISIAIYGLPDKNINDYNKQQTFTSIFQNKFHRMRFAHKPIFITEFGVKGPEAYQEKWLEEAASTINKYPEVQGISYFNFADTPKAWGDAETPDWSITDSTFKRFTGLLKDLPK